MPIYEFRCQACGHLFEILQMVGQDKEALGCPGCGGEELERVLSPVAHTMGKGKGPDSSGPQVTTRSCAGGSCETITLPGHTK